MKQLSRDSSIHLRVEATRNGVFHFALDGRLDADTTGKIWRQATQTLARARASHAVLDLSNIDYCDGSGIALLAEMRQRQQQAGGAFEIHGLRPEFQDLLDAWHPEDLVLVESPAERRKTFVEEVGKAVLEVWRDIYSLISFVGELTTALVKTALHLRRVRWKETLRIAEAVGVNAVPIVALIGFLMGLIMAFQAAIPLRQFGAQLYVANLIGLSILRELGPLMTAIVVAGRSGSAFAAELGTMKVREEIDALVTMGLDPVRFLVVTRVIAAVLMKPLLTIFLDLIGVFGGSVVLLSLGFSWITFFHQVQSAVTYGSF